MRKVLYVDDEIHNLTTLEYNLRKWFKIYTLESPLDAFDLITRENIGVVITDQKMPQMKGLEFASKLKEQFSNVIIIMLTAYADSDIMLQAINQGGIYRFLLKPWDLKDMRQTLENAFETYELRERNQTLVKVLLTQNNELRLKEKKFRLIFENSPLGIAHFDKGGLISRFNEKFSKITGLEKDSDNNAEFLDSAPKEITNALKKAIRGNQDVSFEGNISFKPGSVLIPVRAIFTPVIEEDMVDGCIMLIEDLTSKYEQEELNKQIELIKESARFKQNFLAEMSHEMRTPLTGVMGMIDILNQTDLNKEQKEHTSVLKQSVEELREIINQVLDYSKIEAGKIRLKTTTFHFSNIFNKAEKLFNSICKKSIALEFRNDKNIPEFVVADELRIMQIINNLLTNAIKFTDQGKIILQSKLVSRLGNTDQYKLKISVTDTGIGIPKDLQKLLFTPYLQIDDQRTRKLEGTGLGLSICKQLARLHGGEIGLRSEPGKGSTFWFTVMVKEATSNQIINNSSSQKSESHFSGSLRILLAEDKKVNQKVLKLLLEGNGHKVTIAENGQEIIEIYEPGSFDLILMDIHMPVLDGVASTGKLKKMHKSLPPVIGLSASGLEGDREKYMSLGLDEYLTKPFRKEEFDSVLSRLGLIS